HRPPHEDGIGGAAVAEAPHHLLGLEEVLIGEDRDILGPGRPLVTVALAAWSVGAHGAALLRRSAYSAALTWRVRSASSRAFRFFFKASASRKASSSAWLALSRGSQWVW